MIIGQFECIAYVLPNNGALFYKVSVFMARSLLL